MGKKRSLNRKFLALLLVYGALIGGCVFLGQYLAPMPLWQWLLSLGAILLLIIGSAYWYLANLVTDPLVDITRNIQLTENLDHTAHCLIDSNDELGRLANSLNALYARLQDQHKEIQKLYKQEKQQRKDQNKQTRGLSHEMKTPLAVILSHASSIQRGLTKKLPEERAQIMMQEVDRLTGLLDNLLELAKHSEGINTPLQPCNLVKLVTSTTERLCTQEQYDHITYAIDIPDKPWYIDADPSSLEKVFTNLISNANKYTTEGVVTISLTQQTGLYYFSIKNKAKPFTPDDLDNIWKKFERRNQEASQNSGHGLGLATVKQILDNHHFVYLARYTNENEFEVEIQFPAREETQRDTIEL